MRSNSHTELDSAVPRTLLVVGADIGSRVVWTWQWDDESIPRHEVLARQDVDSWVAEFETELPSERRVAGPRLSNPEAELELSRDLASSIFPELLRAEINERCSGVALGLLRIVPPRSADVIPWGLLPYADDKRLVEVMDIVQVAPPLSRDGIDEHPQTWNAGEDIPMRVVDPYTVDTNHEPRWVLAELVDPEFDADVYKWSETDGYLKGDFRPDLRRDGLSERLRADDYSHWLWVGHVENSQLVLTGGKLSASELFLGGRDVWPMPARIGLVACESGRIWKQAEPFGLVIAALEAGAELVIATQWTLPTDMAFAEQAAITTVDEFRQMTKPFNDAAHKVDEALQSPNPVRALCDWQREQLRTWRCKGDLVDSPVIWASLTSFHAPYRTEKVATQDPNPV